MRRAPVALAALLLACAGVAPWSPAAPTAASFARARAESRPILLSIRAGWCHWCHVMESTTYRDPAVLALLRDRFVVVGAEADARPDLAERYAEHGWPATVLLTPEGDEIVALRGYREPRRFEAILRAVIADQDAGRPLGASLDRRTIAADRAPAEDLGRLHATLLAQLDATYDPREEGWGTPQKYPFAGPVLHALAYGRLTSDAERTGRALRTLAQHARLIDPVWGGMYQYSEGGVWDRPHYEKLAAIQAGAIETFTAAHRETGDARWLAHRADVVRYVRERLRDPATGAFYASQDADAPDADGATFYSGDRAGREPRIDRAIHASANGELIAALAAAGELDLALPAARAILASHVASRLASHAPGEARVHHLADQVHLVRAFLALHEATSDRAWLDRALALTDAALAALRAPSGGLYARTEDPDLAGALAERRIPPIENALFARALLTLARLADRDGLEAEALAALRAIAIPAELALLGRKVGEILIALELAERGLVVAHVIGPRDDARTRALLDAARAWPDPRRVVEHAEPGSGRYPYPGEPTAFLCSRDSCSLPLTDPATLARDADAFVAAE